jgi:hypothetical protein
MAKVLDESDFVQIGTDPLENSVNKEKNRFFVLSISSVQ